MSEEELLELAWNIIANVDQGNWDQSPEWLRAVLIGVKNISNI
jgi:hypothetical protein